MDPRLEKKEIVFNNRQRIGDMLMFTCGIRDFKKAFPDVRVGIRCTARHIFDHNPYLDLDLTMTPENECKIGPSRGTNQSNRIDWHFANAFRISMEDALGVKIQQGESRPDIWLTQEEWDAPRPVDKPYWIISLNGEKGWGCKMYPFSRFQNFVEMNPDVTFVQIGTKEDNPPRLQGDNIIDMVGQTQSKENGIRDLFRLFLNAEGSIGLVSFHLHLSAAFYKPTICIAGAREPVSFTRYQGNQYLSTEGTLPCSEISACWHCAIDTCPNLRTIDGEKVPACVDLITPEDLTRALNAYYIGGRLDKNRPSDKPLWFKNVFPTPPKKEVVNVSKYGMEWGGGCITDRDWDFMLDVIKKNDVNTVLEFGSGLSTLLMNDLGLKVITYETNQGWIDKLNKIRPGMDIRMWDGHSPILIDGDVDFAFVDGPAGGASREFSTMYSSQMARVIIVHDANRENERKWQDKYIKGKFKGPGKGGHRCHLWVKEASHGNKKDEQGVSSKERIREESKQAEPEQIPGPEAARSSGVFQAQKRIKIVSTARGWGGQARSVTTIMRRLLEAGHQVEFIPFRNNVGSREFRECINSSLDGLIVTGTYDTIKDPCDILFVYADDFVWEFTKPEIAEIFHGAKAARKIMMLNYRRGKVGEEPWTRGWDKYMFLNSTQESELLKVHPGVRTRVLPPCTELDPFFKVKPDYNTNLRIVRHSSQGDTKFGDGACDLMMTALDSRDDVTIDMMPGPSICPQDPRYTAHRRTADAAIVAEFLERGNLFWYSLPLGYMDMGPRVILEAMAAGLPVLADHWGGAVDRVTQETGWLCWDKSDHIEVIKNLTPETLKRKGEASRQRAREEFAPEVWIEEIVNG